MWFTPPPKLDDWPLSRIASTSQSARRSTPVRIPGAAPTPPRLDRISLTTWAIEGGEGAPFDAIAIGLILAFALQGAMNFIQVYLLTGTSERVIARLREDVFAHLVRLSPGFFTERSPVKTAV